MRKLLLVLFLSGLLSGCSFSLIPESTNPSPTAKTPFVPVQPSETPTSTPTVPSPTYTLTPTPLGGEPTAIETGTPTITPEIIQLVLGGSLTETSFVQGFVSVLLSASQIYWGECDLPHSVILTAQVNEPGRVADVSLFMRLKNKTSQAHTDWDSGVLMTDQSNGTFVFTIDPEDIRYYFNYSNAWVQMQLITLDGSLRILDRSPVFAESLGLSACAPD